MPNTIKQAVEYICKQAAWRYAPKVWLNVPFTLTNETDGEGYRLVEVMVNNIIRKVLWDPRAPLPTKVSTCILVSDGFGNVIATAHHTNLANTRVESEESEKPEESEEKQE